jgi:hypothetical protein
MTHDELLARIKEGQWVDRDEMHLRSNALRAVVELHKPREEVTGINDRGDVLSSHIICNFCTVLGAFSIKYPCPTIVAIEKELG